MTKISLAVVAAIAFAAATLLLMQGSGGAGVLNGSFTTGINNSINRDWGSSPSPSRWPDVPLNDVNGQVPDVRF